MLSLSSNGLLVLSRGDNATLPLFLNAGTDIKPIRYTLQKVEENGEVILKDEVYVAITEPNQPFECAIVKKKYDYRDLNKRGDVLIQIKHEDTRCLREGKYFYSIIAKFIKKETNINDDTYGTYYIYNYETKSLDEIYLNGNNFDPNQTYYSIVVNTVVPKKEMWIE